ncbi:MAG TPA: putative ABC exporter domain-containing protein, partial [Gemmatimonadaceae bacterium]|nr:putative ABC exporter domain-containing protein [Gemmatimonadaceae bacterium]
MNALAYLVWTSTRNRFAGTIRRARSPRYALALIIGAVYLWWFLFRPVGRGAPSATSILLGQPTEMVVTLLVASLLMGAWLFGADSTALAFTQAEVSILFAAPLSRRQLIKYKLFRAQIVVMINALIWVFILKRGGTLIPSPLRAIGLWVLFSTLNMHRLGAALIRTAWQEHGVAGVRRNIGSILVFGAIAAAVVAGIVEGRSSLSGVHTLGGFFAVLGRILAVPPASWGLYPVHLIVAPTFARSTVEWLRAMLPALGILLAHTLWVLRTDVAFEDAAIAASAERARRIEAMRSRRSLSSAAPRAAAGSLALAAVGRPSFAIVWKNILCLRRTMQLRVFIAPLVAAVAIGSAIADQTSWGP